ncbi:MAG: DNA repair protein RadC [Chlamydiales bacterium]
MTSLKRLPTEERPRERLLNLGPTSLSTRELLAILLTSGVKGHPVLALADTLLVRFRSLSGLAKASIYELRKIKGIGPAKAIQLKAALSLSLRIVEEKREKVCTPDTVYAFVQSYLAHERREVFGALLLNVRDEILRFVTISIGTLTQTLIHPREVFRAALEDGCYSLILVHNHPSGDSTPSAQDIQVTKTLVEAGQLLKIPIIDHIIVSNRGYYSLKEQNSLKF